VERIRSRSPRSPAAASSTCHLKDVDEAKAERVRSGEVAFREAVLDGLFVPLGEGGVDIAGVSRRSRSRVIAAGTCWSRT
jgi:inosose dehydratase